MSTFSAGTVVTSTWLNGVDTLVNTVFSGATTAALARTALGLGTMSTQAASAVAITGGLITGITALAVADGGTGASTATAARSNLSAASSGANTDITSLSAPALGAATATTASALDNSTKVATTAFVNYLQGTFTASLTGCTAGVTGSATYSVVNGIATVRYPPLSGTSNTTAATLTGAPTAIRPVTGVGSVLAFTTDNSGASVAALASVGTDGVITLTKDAAGGAFTNVGIKGIVNGLTLTYLLI